jgi:hypothetical protein
MVGSGLMTGMFVHLTTGDKRMNEDMSGTNVAVVVGPVAKHHWTSLKVGGGIVQL